MNVKKITSIIAASAMMLVTIAPSSFATGTIGISGNGAFSDNFISVSNHSSNTLTQTNNSNFQNNVVSTATTGGNNSSFNTGGNTRITTGNAISTVDITNKAGMNIASVMPCGCNDGIQVGIGGNGAFSHNFATVNSTNTNRLSQTNNTHVTNNVDASAKTGNNSSSFNTGNNGMNNWNNSFSPFLTTSGWNWNGSSWMWNNNSNNFPSWWNNWFTGNNWNWNGSGWSWNMNNNGSTLLNTGSAASHVSINNASGLNVAH
jgi:hypothetical protein